MMPTTTTTTTMGALSSKAMLVTLNIRQWSGVREDKEVAAEVARKYGNDPSAGRYTKFLVPKEVLEPGRKIASAARTEHYFLTLPWSDDGFRILSSAGYFTYQSKMSGYRVQFDSWVQNELAPNYPQWRDDAKNILNGLWRPADYPEVNKLVGMYGFRTSVKPVPDAQDFRVDIGDTELARVRQEITESVESTVKLAMADAWQRLVDKVQHMSDRLRAYEETADGVKNPFRDSVVNGLIDLLDVLPSLNITGDAGLTLMADKVKRDLTLYSADVLRSRPEVRDEVADAADSILAKMQDYM